MIRVVVRTVLAALVLLAAVHAASADCLHSTPEIDGMSVRQLRLTGPGERRFDLEVRVADSRRETAAGFQHVCPEIAARTSILFLFSTPVAATFHMRNVWMPLDIAFIDDAGVIRSIQTMRPYAVGVREQKLWRSPVPIAAALEVRAGLFADRGVAENTWSVSLLP